MQDEIIEKLVSFGLTGNQAKVYLSIVQSGTTSVNRISKDTRLHRQDIYKMLPKLEKMGLITKTIDMPFMVNAVPIETGLHDLFLMFKQKSEENLNSLECNVRDLIDQVKAKPSEDQDTKLTLLTTDKAIKNREDLSFKNTTNNIDFIIDEELLNTAVIRYVCDHLQTSAKNGIGIRLIIEAPECSDLIRRFLAKINCDNNCFTAKIALNTRSKNYQIFDSRELCISTQQKTESEFPCILWTNDENIIIIYKDHFAKIWEEAELINLPNETPLQLASVA